MGLDQVALAPPFLAISALLDCLVAGRRHQARLSEHHDSSSAPRRSLAAESRLFRWPRRIGLSPRARFAPASWHFHATGNRQITRVRRQSVRS